MSQEYINKERAKARDLSGKKELSKEEMKKRMSSMEMQWTKLPPEGYRFEVATPLGAAPVKYIIVANQTVKTII